ncbi:MAG: hypothetical protein H8E49_00820 [Gammaproteobacteria bacterium]|nr:hypothetical protein [Gammaproteobacteria bacterium]
MSDDFFDRLKQHYTDEQVLELGMMIGQFIGFGRVLMVLDLESKFCAVEGANPEARNFLPINDQHLLR